MGPIDSNNIQATAEEWRMCAAKKVSAWSNSAMSGGGTAARGA